MPPLPQQTEIKGAVEQPQVRSPAGAASATDYVRAAVVFLFLAGVVWAVVRWAVGMHALRQLMPASQDATGPAIRLLDELNAGRKRVTVRVSKIVEVPVTFGVFHPIILLPDRLVRAASEANLRYCLAHELSHVRRHDIIQWWALQWLEPLLWIQPAFWWLRHELRICQDQLADHYAAEQSGDAISYAQFLVHLGKARSRAFPTLALTMADGCSSLSRRVRMLLSDRLALSVQSRRSVVLATAICMLMLASGTGALRLGRAHAETPPSANEEGSPPDDALAESGVISGVIIREDDGTPVPGARVILRGGRADYTESDTQGRFRFEDVQEEHYRIWAHKDHLVTGRKEIHTQRPDASGGVRFAPLRLTMSVGKSAQFRVTSAVTEEPISGAIVRFGFPDRRTHETGDDGICLVQGLLPETYEVTIEAKDHAFGRLRIGLSHADLVTDFSAMLSRGGVIHGVVVDEQGQLLPEVLVVFDEPGSSAGFYGDSPRTDAAGAFRHRYLPLNTPIDVSFRLDGFERETRQVTLSAEAREHELRVELRRRPTGGSIAGVVQDQEGRPIAGAKIDNHGSQIEAQRTATTDAEGRFVLHDLVEGYTGFEIFVHGNGYEPQLVNVKPGPPDAPAPVEITLHPGHSIRGRVVDEQGKPLAGAYVSVRSGTFPHQLGQPARSDDDGHFAFDSLPQDARFDVYVPKHTRLSSHELPLDADDRVEVALEPMGIIRGRVVDDESGEPVPRLKVRLGFSRERLPSDPKPVGIASDLINPGLVFESAQGLFTIEDLANRSVVELNVLADGYRKAVVPRAVAATEATAKELEVRLEREDPVAPFTLAGRILDHEERPVEGAQLRLIVSPERPKGRNDNNFNWVLIESGQLADRPWCDQFLATVSNAAGEFTFANVLPERHLQLVYWGERVPKGRSLGFDRTQPGATESVTVRLPRPGTIRGAFDRSRFADAGSVSVSHQQDSWHEYEVNLSDGQEAFEIANLPPGEYSVAVRTKPERHVEDGQIFYRITPMASVRIRTFVKISYRNWY